jgi:hypothetical protein
MRTMRTTSKGLTRVLAAAVVAVVAGGGPATAMDVTVENHGVRPLDGLYLSATAQSAWGPDLLNGGGIPMNGAWTVQVGCAQTFVVVAEDAAGCFLYESLPCGDATTWTITSDSPRDCGR